MALRVQIQGGPHDGEVVPYMGPEMRRPRPARRTFVFDDAERLPPANLTFNDDRYLLMRGHDGELYYVAETEARTRQSS